MAGGLSRCAFPERLAVFPAVRENGRLAPPAPIDRVAEHLAGCGMKARRVRNGARTGVRPHPALSAGAGSRDAARPVGATNVSPSNNRRPAGRSSAAWSNI